MLVTTVTRTARAGEMPLSSGQRSVYIADDGRQVWDWRSGRLSKRPTVNCHTAVQGADPYLCQIIDSAGLHATRRMYIFQPPASPVLSSLVHVACRSVGRYEIEQIAANSERQFVKELLIPKTRASSYLERYETASWLHDRDVCRSTDFCGSD